MTTSEPSRLDISLNESFKRMQEEQAERERRQVALRDPFKKPKTEPGRARPGHGRRHTTLDGNNGSS